MTTTVSGTSGIIFPDSSVQSASSAVSGFTCYWANGTQQTAGRAGNTVYQNTSGKTRFVLYAYQILGGYIYIDNVNGSTTKAGYNQAGGGAPWNTTFIVVPNGWYYKFENTSTVIYSWTEWQ